MGGFGQPSATDYFPLTWSFGAWGQNLLASPRNQTILAWTNAKAETTTSAYDTNGYLQSVTGPISGANTTFAYDSYGRRRRTTASDGYATTTDYDALDRPTRVTYPDGTYDSVVYSRLERALMNSTDLFLFESAFARDTYQRTIGIPAGLVRCGSRSIAL